MQCSWKVFFLLALASIAIPYTVIRRFIDNPSHTYSIPCPLKRDLGHNVSTKTHILILANRRSGSSFFGQLFNHHPDVFYLYEPLYHVQFTLNPSFAYDRRVTFGAGRDLLRGLFDCDLHSLESYIDPIPENHITNKVFGHGASKALCSPPVCTFSPNQVNVEESDCHRTCARLNLTLASISCRERRHVVIKTVRVPDVSDLKILVDDPRLNLKVIQLVRDPRGILASGIRTFLKDPTYQPWKNWQETGNRVRRVSLTKLKVCEDFLSSVSAGLSQPQWLKGRYMLVRYEDLALNTLRKTKEIYEYLGMTLDKNVVAWIQNNTRGSDKKSEEDRFSTKRDSAANAEIWRLSLSYDIVDYLQTVCQETLQMLGYKSVRSPEELKNMSLSLVEDKTFVPFL